MVTLTPITNTPRDYAWGTVDGISLTLGRPGSGGPEAELWLGSHALSPARRADAAGDAARSGQASWPDLAAWEQQTGHALPYLLKLLSAAHPLSLQAHPTTAQAAAGFAREEAAGIPLTARERNYKDPHAKPELIVAVADGFEALCGFRPLAQTVDAVRALASASSDPDAFAPWLTALAAGVRPAFDLLLSQDAAVRRMLVAVAALTPGTARPAADSPVELVTRLLADYPGDAGVLVAVMLNHVTLAAGQSLWLPAGNIHAYLRGTGVELMGPSDNVLRGGLTPKHVDRAELSAVLDMTPGEASWLPAVSVTENVVAYRPAALPSGAGIDFELLLVTGAATVRTGSAAIALAVEGDFTVAAPDDGAAVAHGEALFIDAATTLTVTGSGRLFVATGL